ncbi:pro-sigmaK processing inhibitor BofA family protein [Clostridiaceae bacterium 35-E11]
MGMGVELNIILAYAFGLILLYIVGYILLIPIKWMIKLIYNGVIGGIMLIVLNFVGRFWGVGIAVNPITALVAGILGVPGVILMFILQYLI